MNNTLLVIQREYLQRVKKKSFIITTILMPVLMGILMVAPALLMNLDVSESKNIGVVDQSGIIFDKLEGTSAFSLVRLDVDPDSAKRMNDYDAFLIISPDVMENNRNVTLYSHGASSLGIEVSLASQIERAIEDLRLESMNMSDARQAIDSVRADVSISTFRLDRKDEAVSTSTGISYATGFLTTIILYMFILMYGQMVMTTVIEEKSTRVLDLLVTSVKPTQLMLGKILGVGLVAVTQVLIWCSLLVGITSLVLPALLSPEIINEVSMMNSGQLGAVSDMNPEALQALSFAIDPANIISLFGYMLAFLVGGFLLYASIFAAVGSAVDNIQDAAQLQSIIIIPLIIGFICSMTVVNNPETDMALWLSIIPFTSPMVMMARIPFGIPGWQIAVSIIILYLSFVLMTWLAAKVYRIGIFMHGKKPSIKDLISWMKYK